MTRVGQSQNAATPGQARRASADEASASFKDGKSIRQKIDDAGDKSASLRSDHRKTPHNQPVNPGLQKTLQAKKLMRQQTAYKQAGAVAESAKGQSGQVRQDLEADEVFHDPEGQEFEAQGTQDDVDVFCDPDVDVRGNPLFEAAGGSSDGNETRVAMPHTVADDGASSHARSESFFTAGSGSVSDDPDVDVSEKPLFEAAGGSSVGNEIEVAMPDTVADEGASSHVRRESFVTAGSGSVSHDRDVDVSENPLFEAAGGSSEGNDTRVAMPHTVADDGASSHARSESFVAAGSGSVSVRGRALCALQGSNLVVNEKQAGETIDAEQKAIYRNASLTAAKQGSIAYALSFGVFGLASRAAGVTTEAFNQNPFIKGAVNTVAPSTMPLAHGAAGKAAAPGDEATKLIPPTSRETPLPPNAIGNAFRPFIGGLMAGNTAVSGVVDGGIAARNAIVIAQGGQSLGARGNTSIQGVIKNALFFIPGLSSGIHTARNVYATQAQAGQSLQEPAKDVDGRQVGVVVTHQTAIQKENDRHEIGQVKIDSKGERIAVAIDRRNDGTTEPRRLQTTSIEETPTLKARAQAFIRDLAPRLPPRDGGEGHRWGISAGTAAKTTALASTLAVNAAVSHYVKPAVKEALQARGVEPAVADPISTVATTAISSILLGWDFIPKFMTFDQPVAPADATSASPRTWREFIGKTDAGKILQTSIPGAGGIIALATGRADVYAAPRLNAPDTTARFETLAENKVEMFAVLEQHSPGTVVRADDGTLRIRADKAGEFIRRLEETAQQTPS